MQLESQQKRPLMAVIGQKLIFSSIFADM